MSITNRDNATWLSHLRSGSSTQASALSDLREALLHGLRRALSSRRIVDDSMLEDVVQDSLVRILDRLEQFQGHSRFLTWATSIAVNVAMSELRRRRWKDVSLDSMIADVDFVSEHAVDADAGPHAQWERMAVVEKLHELIAKALTEKQRTALLAELKGIPQDEIAKQLGTNRNALYKLTHDARKKLKRGLEAAGISAKDVVATTAN